MPLTQDEIEEIGKRSAKYVLEGLEALREDVATRDLLVTGLIGEGAILVHGRENRKAVCHGCRIDPSKPLEAGNVMVTTEDAIGTLSAQEVRNLCSEIVEMPDGRCQRAQGLRLAAQECKVAHPGDSQKYFECFIPKFRELTTARR